MENFYKILSLVLFCMIISLAITFQYQKAFSDGIAYYEIATKEHPYSSILTVFLMKITGFLQYNQFIFLWILFFHLSALSIFVVGFNRLDLAVLSTITPYFVTLSFAFAQMFALLFFFLTLLALKRKNKIWIVLAVLTMLSQRCGFILIAITFISLFMAKLFKKSDISLIMGAMMFGIMGISIGFAAEIYILIPYYYDIFTHCIIIIPLLYLFFETSNHLFWKFVMLLFVLGSIFLPFIIPQNISSTTPYIVWRTFGMLDIIVLFALAETKTRIDEFFFGILFLAMGIKTAIGVV